MKKYIIFLIIVFICVILAYSSTKKEHVKNIKKSEKALNTDQYNSLINCLVDIDKVFNDNNLYYIIAYGTLLGAVRHHDIIPWDDDADIIIKHIDLELFEKCLKQIEKLGYQTEKTWKLYRVFPIKDKENKNLFIDFFIVDTDQNNNVKRCCSDKNKCISLPEDQNWWWDEYKYNGDLLKNRVRYNFGKIKLWGPKDAKKLLTHWYGPDCLTKCKTHNLLNHSIRVVPEDIEFSDFPEPQLY
jgi:hypothetical protein